MPNSFIFDLDDTLYKEIEYVKSGFNAVADFVAKESGILEVDFSQVLISDFKNNKNAFRKLIKKYNLNIQINDMLKIYRNHKPNIKLGLNTIKTLEKLRGLGKLEGIITDGRSIQQRNKIKALGLDRYFSNIVISEEIGSEKPDMRNFLIFDNIVKKKLFYIGDNFKKDFVTPKKLGWTTICLLDNGENIHKQDFSMGNKYLPHHLISELKDILKLIDEK